MKRVGVLISGRGSNLQALIDAQARFSVYEIAAVISNVPGAHGLERARRGGIHAQTIDHKPFGKNREAFEREVDAALRTRNVEIVALAGFMRILTPYFVRAWSGRMLNVHPSLLPSFPGRDTHARALEAGVRLHGCSVHVVTDELDAGPIIGQAAIPVLPGDTPESLESRLLPVEHQLYPLCLAALCGAEVGAGAAAPLLNAWVKA